MKRIYYSIIFNALFITTLFGQKEAAMWYFGNRAALDFNSGSPVALTNSAMQALEGSASISDKTGSLLFYTDGRRVWNKNHVTMPAGTGLIGNGFGSSTQAALIIPRPGSSSIYYIFTLPSSINSFADGLRYHIVDITQDAGLGDVTSKNNLLWASSTEKITSVKHCNEIDYWVITHDRGNNRFRVFRVSSTGISAPITFNVGGTPNELGQMKASPDGSKIIVASHSSSPLSPAMLFDFDNSTGVISNVLNCPINNAYGAEFSQDGTKVYLTSYRDLTTRDVIYQYDLCTTPYSAVFASPTFTVVPTTPGTQLFGLQLAIDGKIYISGTVSSSQYVGVINNPNILGASCNYFEQGVFLAGRSATFACPTFCQSFFDPVHLKDTNWVSISNTISCLDANFSVKIFNQPPTSTCIAKNNKPVTLQWNFGDVPSGANNFSASSTPNHTFSAPGTYKVQLVIQFNCKSDTIFKTITVANCSCALSANATVMSYISCSGGTGSAVVAITGGNGGPYTYSWSNGTSSVTSQLSMLNSGLTNGLYTVTVTEGSCTAISTVQLLSPPPLHGQFAKGAANCNGCGCKDWIIVNATGGTSPYTYSWPDGYVNRYKNQLCTGSYLVNVKDKNGCSANVSLSVP